MRGADDNNSGVGPERCVVRVAMRRRRHGNRGKLHVAGHCKQTNGLHGRFSNNVCRMRVSLSRSLTRQGDRACEKAAVVPTSPASFELTNSGRDGVRSLPDT